ncbi:hypothetical protein ABFS82_13G029000 [Erythranthe guttata]|uniref:Uncharacterized protein n=1 Tax=Erythranthe guttata TaxID=4155 RepID=A0A022QHM3_ERYGU|nr:PREDICTED: O-acyltransferase WSD1-like [Erythranthe guttata]EYU28207.1 hypothetical protein MIMGU_mgv1a006155mg [Erythranthe guttata]|eukprot:XP_012848331.1 PREDICTED: O-acyltransferase WSD1-like [Erythranthe guttata]
MEEEITEPVSPTGQYFTSSVISVSVIAVLEFEFPIDDSQTATLLENVFLPINPRFSSLMVKGKNGKKHWKKVEVNVKEHVKTPNFPRGKSPEFYEECLSEYLSKISLEQFQESRPLWEIHIIKYPTKSTAGNLVFKLHHSLGDGYSLMGALLSCLQRADNPQLPLTFPLLNQKIQTNDNKSNILSRAFDSVYDFGWSVLKSLVLEDDKTPIRSGDDGVEFRPITVTTLNFSLDQIKKVKASLHVSINDVICGVLFLGIGLYAKSTKVDQSSTALVLLNTRNINGYKSISEMVEPDAESPWGNQFAFLHVSVPKLVFSDQIDPLSFVLDAQKEITRKRNSAAVVLTGKLLEMLMKLRGPEVTAKYIHRTLKNTSMTISNIMGPLEKMALSNQPIKGMYFMVVGVPQNLTITMVSYMGQLRVALGTENGLIEAPKFRECVQNAFDMIYKAAVPFPSV